MDQRLAGQTDFVGRGVRGSRKILAEEAGRFVMRLLKFGKRIGVRASFRLRFRLYRAAFAGGANLPAAARMPEEQVQSVPGNRRNAERDQQKDGNKRTEPAHKIFRFLPNNSELVTIYYKESPNTSSDFQKERWGTTDGARRKSGTLIEPANRARSVSDGSKPAAKRPRFLFFRAWQ